ncbi:MAG: deoxyguanosinetriphosphate triphosphohydrolase [Candidatus Competibacteraceae bacterium]|nr:deoxyguanosinetriphosphate triphosphohydrolase [Candidatus Competibacteraceae bacterium]
MDWKHLLSRVRLGRPGSDAELTAGDRTRTDFQRDFDRVVFSSAFRRLQDKTQVFPLVRNDYVRTRLTHSLEASCVGRTLGTMVGDELIRRHGLTDVYPQDFGAIVAAACLAHDIGNPPFGHAGEDAIRLWFRESASGRQLIERLDQSQRGDFVDFEGNAQGFRLLTRLQSAANPGGLQLTCAMLGAFTKYPRASAVAGELPASVAFKKFGFMQADSERFTQLATVLELPQLAPYAWQRHPLAYLVEAADDICYRIVDVEDAYRLKHLDYAEAEALLLALLDEPGQRTRLNAIREPKERIEFLRAKSIGAMIDQVFSCFMDREAELLAGQGCHDLLSSIPSASQLAELQCRAQEKIYLAEPVVEVAAAGFQVLGGLLEVFIPAVNEVAERGDAASTRSQMLLRLVPEQFIGIRRQPHDALYPRLLGITDFVSGMTDSYAVNLYKKLTGISLSST